MLPEQVLTLDFYFWKHLYVMCFGSADCINICEFEHSASHICVLLLLKIFILSWKYLTQVCCSDHIIITNYRYQVCFVLQGSYQDYISLDDEVKQLVSHITMMVVQNTEECQVQISTGSYNYSKFEITYNLILYWIFVDILYLCYVLYFVWLLDYEYHCIIYYDLLYCHVTGGYDKSARYLPAW